MRRIGLIVLPGDPFLDETLLGVADHMRRTGSWTIRRQVTPVRTPADLAWLMPWRPEGLLVMDHAGVGVVEGLGLPWVRFRSDRDAQVVFDEHEIGRQAAEHLIESGAQVLAVVVLHGLESAPGWSEGRVEGFDAGCAACGAVPHHVLGEKSGAAVEWPGQIIDWARRQTGPVGVFAPNDISACNLVEACTSAGLEVPRDLAVIGADNWTPWCETISVPLSSVRIPHRAMARCAAERLDRLLDGGPLEAVERIPPLGVAVRASTSRSALGDPALSAALAFIDSHALDRLHISAVALAAGIGRRTLEERFRERFGRSLLDHIHRVRIRRAQRLLAETEQTVMAVALACGFSHLSRFNHLFREVTTLNPSAWRDLVRRQSG